MQALVDEINGEKGRNDAEAVEQDWWRMIDWKTPEYITLFDSLGEETRVTITEAGLCPTCEDEEECPEGEEWNEEHSKCVPMEDPAEDVKETNPGFAPGKAEEECPEGMTWNAEKKQCVEIADFSDRPENKKADEKLDPRKVLEDSEKLL